MSVPRNVPVPSHSSSPSKSSLRRTSGSHNPSSRSLLPSPHFDEPPALGGSGGGSRHNCPRPDESAAAVEASQTAHDAGGAPPLPQQQQPLFQPFFTLIEDSSTHEHFHPTVHYIFADDDADIITEAALRSLQQNQPEVDESQSQSQSQPGAARSQQRPAEEQEEEHGREHENGPDNRYLPRPKEGVREHYIVLDIEPGISSNVPVPTASGEAPLLQPSGMASASNMQSQTGFEVVNAYSMSADWQVLRTGISKAPTMAEDEDGDEEGLMLRIEGRTGTPPEMKVVGESMEEMIERFERGLEDVRLVMEAGRRGEVEGEREEVQGAGSM